MFGEFAKTPDTLRKFEKTQLSQSIGTFYENIVT